MDLLDRLVGPGKNLLGSLSCAHGVFARRYKSKSDHLESRMKFQVPKRNNEDFVSCCVPRRKRGTPVTDSRYMECILSMVGDPSDDMYSTC